MDILVHYHGKPSIVMAIQAAIWDFEVYGSNRYRDGSHARDGSYMHIMHTCIHAYMHTCIHAYMHPYMHTCIHAYMHTCIHAYMHTCIHASMHPCIHAYMHTCIMHTCIHAYMHTYMHNGIMYIICLIHDSVVLRSTRRVFIKDSRPWARRPWKVPVLGMAWEGPGNSQRFGRSFWGDGRLPAILIFRDKGSSPQMSPERGTGGSLQETYIYIYIVSPNMSN